MGYTLNDMVSEFGLTMSEFKKLDVKTQEKWRKIHQRKLKEMQEYCNKIDSALKKGENLPFTKQIDEKRTERESFIRFLNDNKIDEFVFDNFTESQKRVFEKQYLDCKKTFEDFLNSKFLTLEKFYTLEDWKKEEWQKQFIQHQKQEQYWKQRSNKSKDTIMYEDAIGVLIDCHIPFDCSEPLGI